tara:strand:+ start:590 stop:1063 length:474 start_codon:yes stop_codon:yes gene_type:complete
MENKYVGYILIAVSIILIVNIISISSIFNNSNNNFCTADSCPYHNSFNKIIYLSISTVGLLIITGIVLIKSKPEEKTIIKEVEIEKPKKEINTKELTNDEKETLRLIQENKAIFQADLIEKTGYGKVKMTRIIDRLEGKDIVERKRRGMTNIVVMKE